MNLRIGLIADLNDKLRSNLAMGKIEITLSKKVKESPDRAKIIKVVREYKEFDVEIDFNGDHSIGLFIVEQNAYLFRFSYLDDRYDYASEIGRRSLEICHSSEFYSVKLKSALLEKISSIAM